MTKRNTNTWTRNISRFLLMYSSSGSRSEWRSATNNDESYSLCHSFFHSLCCMTTHEMIQQQSTRIIVTDSSMTSRMEPAAADSRRGQGTSTSVLIRPCEINALTLRRNRRRKLCNNYHCTKLSSTAGTQSSFGMTWMTGTTQWGTTAAPPPPLNHPSL